MIKLGSFRSRTRRELAPGLLLMLLAVVVLVPTGCVLWFMTKAMQNERLASQQKLQEAYKGHLALLQGRLNDFWELRGSTLDERAESGSASEAFAHCAEDRLASSVICLSAEGAILYPDAPALPLFTADEAGGAWIKASALPHRSEGDAAAALQALPGSAITDPTATARALQARARTHVQAGLTNEAIAILNELATRPELALALDSGGRAISPNADLLLLELIRDQSHPGFKATLDRLHGRLVTYRGSALRAGQRRFLMNAARELAGAAAAFPTEAAENLAARYLEGARAEPVSIEPGVLQLTHLPDVWRFMSPKRRMLALVESKDIAAAMHAMIEAQALPNDFTFELLRPSSPLERFLHSMPAGRSMPGWQLAMRLKDRDWFEAAANQRITTYLWTGLVGVLAVCLLALAMARIFRQQMELTRLKNDLVAAVTHELKTPLASMRLLVETLLAAPRIEEQTAREYLQLIARENTRLSRLIDNFLAFSRMERKKYTLEFRPTTAEEIVNSAAEAVRERFQSARCQFQVEIAPGLPELKGDPDALATAVINLLDNAFKYTGDDKRIRLRAYAEDSRVCFEVQDNGQGIPPRETKKIFTRFYQVDSSLSRASGGCGLGLSIVQFIARAHRGSVRVQSEPGQGSTFTIVLEGSE